MIDLACALRDVRVLLDVVNILYGGVIWVILRSFEKEVLGSRPCHSSYGSAIQYNNPIFAPFKFCKSAHLGNGIVFLKNILHCLGWEPCFAVF